jgi:hypothetical protein
MKHIEPFSREMWIDFGWYMLRNAGPPLAIGVVLGTIIGITAAYFVR